MSFNIALSGLNAVNEQLNTISHNISNVGTTGFKSSRTEFGSVYAESQMMGVEVLATTQSISQRGALVGTGSSLDLAIAGDGFFTVRSASGEVQYTRAGVFGPDKDNFVTTPNGARVQGYGVDAAGNLQVGAVGDLQLSSANLPARASDSLDFVANLNANDAVPPVAVFDPADSNSFNSTYTSRVYDSLGREHTFTQYFVKTAENAWQSHYYLDGTAVGAPTDLDFSTAGALTAPTAPVTLTANVPGADAISIDLDYTGTSQFGSPFVVTTNVANGYTAGEQIGMAVEKNGMIYANYSNGQRMLQGQVVLANFANAQGLRNETGTAWSETADSGQALLGVPGVGSFGALAASTLEGSNVDLTQQLVNLMEGQRNYQANSKVLTTNKELTQVLFNAI